MNNLLYIFINILSPIFIQIGLGYLIRKKFELSVQTLTKVQMYILIPGLLFYNIYTSNVSGSEILTMFGFTAAVFFILMALAWAVSRIMGLKRAKEKAFINSVILRNQGNFGIPLIALAFAGPSGDYAMSLHMMVLLATNILLNTFGLYNASSGAYTAKEALKNIFRLPMLYVIALAFLLKGLGIGMPDFVMSTTKLLSNGMVAVALITLGVQLASTKVNFRDISIYLSNILRLVISPLVAWLLTLLLGIEGVAAQVLILGAAAPSAVNSVLMAVEFKGDATYASETVFTSTLLSSVTVAVVVSLVI